MKTKKIRVKLLITMIPIIVLGMALLTYVSVSQSRKLINEQITNVTYSEDKKLGFYFCKATNGVITAERFVSKVLFYVYNDVFKDYGLDRDMFKGEDDKSMSFQSYYNFDGSINETKVVRFLKNLKVKSFTEDLPAVDNNNPEQHKTETSE